MDSRGRWLPLVVVACAAAAHAQPAAPDAATQEGLRRQEERSRQLRDQQPTGPDVLSPPQGKPAEEPFAAESPCFTIREIQLSGEGWERFAWIADAAMPYLRQCVGVRGLSRIAASLDAALLEKGFATTRVSLPQQNLQAGTLQVRVHIGRIAGVRLADAGDSNAGTWRNAFPLAQGDVLNIRDVEQGVEQMRRLPSQQVSTRLEPGAEPDTSVVVIERKSGDWRERLRGAVTIDNSGSPTLGRAQLSASAAYDNPLGINDIVSASLSSNLQQPTAEHRSQSFGLNWSVPWGYSLFSVGASTSRFAQHVQGTTVRFLSSGHSETADAHLSHVLWRGSSAKLSATAGVSIRRARSYIDDVELVVQRRRTTQGDVSLAWRQLLETSTLDLELGVRQGLSWNAQEDLQTAAQGGPTLRPRIVTFSAQYNTQFRTPLGPVQYAASLRGQTTRDTTLAIDQFSIGGRHSVRGFDGDTVLLAESGATLRNDFSVPVPLWTGANTAWTFAVDVGRVWGASDLFLPGHMLAGAATGIRGSYAGVLFDLSLAVPLHRPANFPARPWTAYASFTYPF